MFLCPSSHSPAVLAPQTLTCGPPSFPESTLQRKAPVGRWLICRPWLTNDEKQAPSRPPICSSAPGLGTDAKASATNKRPRQTDARRPNNQRLVIARPWRAYGSILCRQTELVDCGMTTLVNDIRGHEDIIQNCFVLTNAWIIRHVSLMLR